MLYVQNELVEVNLDKALKFAHKINMEHNLLQQLHRMGNGWSKDRQYICFLYNDFAPHSFGFDCIYLRDCFIRDDGTITRLANAHSWLSGGLIYHGPLEDGKESEPFSVQLTKHDGWSIHT